jgi:meiotically up-regulated gene 157 (Mug157) protein
VKSLQDLVEMAESVNDVELEKQAKTLADEVQRALQQYAFTNAPGANYARMYVYEVDGYGNQSRMDDANVPSLLSLPYLDCVGIRDGVYRSTRRFVLSENNPYFFSGKAAEGIGGPHVGLNMIWPLAIIMRGLTSTDDKEVAGCLKTLMRTHAGTGFMHESFDKDDPSKFTRKWFAWANTLFGEFVLKMMQEWPAVVKSVA